MATYKPLFHNSLLLYSLQMSLKWSMALVVIIIGKCIIYVKGSNIPKFSVIFTPTHPCRRRRVRWPGTCSRTFTKFPKTGCTWRTLEGTRVKDWTLTSSVRTSGSISGKRLNSCCYNPRAQDVIGNSHLYIEEALLLGDKILLLCTHGCQNCIRVYIEYCSVCVCVCVCAWELNVY